MERKSLLPWVNTPYNEYKMVIDLRTCITKAATNTVLSIIFVAAFIYQAVFSNFLPAIRPWMALVGHLARQAGSVHAAHFA